MISSYKKRIRNPKKYLSQCGYCRLVKQYPDDFTSEHVISQSLGLFGIDTMTLIDLVCRECNQYFGDNLELHLGKDSVFGILYRTIAGVIDYQRFQKTICHKRTRIEPLIH